MIFRNDDINPSTDLDTLYEMYEVIGRLFPSSMIISCVTLFGIWNDKQAVYPDLPLKNKPTEWFYNVNRVLHKHSHVIGDIASHGLFHVKHSTLSRDAQEMSILGSCNFLNTKKFVAPFNDYNANTVDICKGNGIELLTKEYDWKSLEFNKFNPDHKFWYFHSWRYTKKQLMDKLHANIEVGNS